jgi:hypothetical protein
LSGGIDSYQEADKFVAGIDVTVPVKGDTEVEITYRLPGSLVSQNGLSRLAIVMPKQPGIINDPVEVIVNHPTFLTVAAASAPALISPQVVTWKTDLTFDRVFTIDFIEK